MNLQKEMTEKKLKYKAKNSKAFLYLFTHVLIGSIGVWCSIFVNWFFGQIVLGVFFLQAFILLHEVGHYSFFKSKKLNTWFGHLFGVLSFIPFASWVDIHNQHHKWTGWRDKDPTTSGTVNAKHGIITKGLVNICWLLFIPLFTLGYRIGNYWNFTKIKKFSPKTSIQSVVTNVIIILFVWSFLIYTFPSIIIKYFFPSYLISLILSDLIILSQHSHIDIPISKGEEVKPIKYSEQIQYTRSVIMGKWIEHWLLFNFNLHEKHHAFPGVPAYYLQEKECDVVNTHPFLKYLWNAKKLSGEEFVFSTTKYSKKII